MVGPRLAIDLYHLNGKINAYNREPSANYALIYKNWIKRRNALRNYIKKAAARRIQSAVRKRANERARGTMAVRTVKKYLYRPPNSVSNRGGVMYRKTANRRPLN